MARVRATSLLTGASADVGKIEKLVEKFARHSKRLKATGIEVGAAIAKLLDLYYETYGAVPVSEQLLDILDNLKEE